MPEQHTHACREGGCTIVCRTSERNCRWQGGTDGCPEHGDS